mmetsp:Transcript_9169/g.55626  ORF Transcript_9169/g.55626 Transcript_9169/m.55626 type:complete len:171 (+) Transcript_9169:217-729(+)
MHLASAYCFFFLADRVIAGEGDLEALPDAFVVLLALRDPPAVFGVALLVVAGVLGVAGAFFVVERLFLVEGGGVKGSSGASTWNLVAFLTSLKRPKPEASLLKSVLRKLHIESIHFQFQSYPYLVDRLTIWSFSLTMMLPLIFFRLSVMTFLRKAASRTRTTPQTLATNT